MKAASIDYDVRVERYVQFLEMQRKAQENIYKVKDHWKKEMKVQLEN